MEDRQKFQQKFYQIIDIARYAPSVHNSQPWKVKFEDKSIIVGIDHAHVPQQSDPTGRQTYISLGIFCEAIAVAARANGLLVTSVGLVQDRATLKVIEKKSSSLDLRQINYLRQRCTDRSVYRPINVTKPMIKKIEESYAAEGVHIKVVADKKMIGRAAEFTAKGIALALTNPEFRRELSRYLILPWGGKKRGISVLSLRISKVLEIFEPLLIRYGLGLKAEVRTERKRWLSSSGIIFITTRGDLQADWFRAGRAYLRASLAAEALGLSQATSAATVEASTFHEDIEKMLGTKQRLQCATRMGHGSRHKVFSPRVPAEALLVTSTQ
ncbi:hypothetical protein HYU82_03265 [Candidatus Saccharibacteria bacterium]|nr:hypothetical protein [Candidatus Saccharibacteria bacterium]